MERANKGKGSSGSSGGGGGSGGRKGGKKRYNPCDYLFPDDDFMSPEEMKKEDEERKRQMMKAQRNITNNDAVENASFAGAAYAGIAEGACAASSSNNELGAYGGNDPFHYNYHNHSGFENINDSNFNVRQDNILGNNFDIDNFGFGARGAEAYEGNARFGNYNIPNKESARHNADSPYRFNLRSIFDDIKAENKGRASPNNVAYENAASPAFANPILPGNNNEFNRYNFSDEGFMRPEPAQPVVPNLNPNRNIGYPEALHHIDRPPQRGIDKTRDVDNNCFSDPRERSSSNSNDRYRNDRRNRNVSPNNQPANANNVDPEEEFKRQQYNRLFVKYIKDVERAYRYRKGDLLSRRLSLRDEHVEIVKYVIDYEAIIERHCSNADLQHIISNHIECMKDCLSRNMVWAFEKQISCTMFVLNLLNEPRHLNENWSLSLLINVARDLRTVAERAAFEGPHGINVDILEAGGDALIHCFRHCIGKKESGRPYIHQELFRLFVLLKHIDHSRPIMQNIYESPFRHFLQIADHANHLPEHRGLYQRFAYADDYLEYAFENCPQDFESYRYDILIRLIPLLLAKKLIPSRELLQRYNLTVFSDINDAVIIGSYEIFDGIMEMNSQFLMEHGIFSYLNQHVRCNISRYPLEAYYIVPNIYEWAFFDQPIPIVAPGNFHRDFFAFFYAVNGAGLIFQNVFVVDESFFRRPNRRN